MPDSLKFQIELADKISAPAKASAAQLKALQVQLKAENTAVKQLEAAMRNLNKANVVDLAAGKRISTELKARKGNVAGLQASLTNLSAETANGAQGAEEMGSSLAGLGSVAAVAGAAVLALGAALGAAVYSGAKLAISAAEQKQDTLDMLEAMIGSADAARDVYSQIEGITGEVAISQTRATELARQLTAAGVTNTAQLTGAIKSIGEVESVLGSEAGNKIQNVLEKAAQTGTFKLQAKQLVGTGIQVQKLYEEIARRTGKGVAEVKHEVEKGTLDAKTGIDSLNAVLSSKFGGAAGKQVLDIGNQFTRFKDNVSRLFEDVDTGPFLAGLHEVLQVFDSSTASGKALKAAMTALFNGLFSAASAALPYIVTGLKQMIIWGLQAYIALRQFAATDTFAVLATGAKVLAAVIGALVGVVIIPALAAILVPILAVGAAFTALSGIVGVVYNAIAAQFAMWVNLGSMLVQGIVQGITGGASAVMGAVKNMAQGALDSFKGVLGIHSPSKVMAQMGGHLTSGLAMGIDAGAPAANDSLGSAVSPAVAQASAQSGGPASGGGGGGASVTFAAGSIVINVPAGGNSAEIKAAVLEALTDAFEQAGLQHGAQAAA